MYKKKNRTKQLRELDKRYIWHPFTQMKDWVQENPLIIESGNGVFLQDTEGRRYIDGVSSLWVNVHGHGKKELDQALLKQLRKVAHSTLLGLSNPPAIELAKELIAVAPHGLTKVFYSDSGSTAVEIALKMAYQYWQHREPGSKRTKFITFGEAYHGDTIGSVSVGGISLFHRSFRPLLFDVVRLPSPYFFREQGKLKSLIRTMEEKIKKYEGQMIGVVMEPLIQAAAGMLVHPKGFLREVRLLCDRYGLLMIIDEIATGFGRTGKMFACEHEAVTPDLMAVAKGITGGYLPLAATFVKENIYQTFLGTYGEFKSFFHGHTYTGNPLACAVALASLKLFKRERLLAKIQGKISWLRRELEKFLNLEHVGEIHQLGMMVGIKLVKKKSPRKEYPLTQKVGICVCQEARKYGVILRPLGNTVVLMPPLSIHQRELKTLLAATYRAIDVVTTELRV